MNNRDGHFCAYIQKELRAKHYYLLLLIERVFVANNTKIFFRKSTDFNANICFYKILNIDYSLLVFLRRASVCC